MAGGSRGRRTYARDNRGRFASTGTTRSRPAPKQAATRGTNRLTRNNSGRIVGIGRNGATARGGRLRTAAGNQRATQTARLKKAPLQGVVTRAGKARAGSVAPKAPPRIANRSAADQAHRDKIAKQWKTVEKPARRAAAISRATFKAAAGLPPAYPRLSKARKIGGDSRYIRENIAEQTARLMRSPSRGKNKLTPQQRGQIVSDVVYSARSLRARAAMTEPRRRTREIRAARPGGTIAKPKGLKPGALTAKAAKPATPRGPATSRLRPGELMNAVARPVGTMAKPRRGENPFSLFVGGANVEANLKAAEAWAAKNGIRTERYKERKRIGKGAGVAIARARQSDKTMLLNVSNDYWNYPRTEQIRMRRLGWHSSSSPMAVLRHEQGHLRDRRLMFRWQEAVNTSTSKAGRTRRYRSFETAANPTMPKAARKRRGKEIQALSRRVSRYATTNPSEFIAETYAGIKTGRRYDYQVMRAYREAMGLSPNPAARRRSRIRRAKP